MCTLKLQILYRADYGHNIEIYDISIYNDESTQHRTLNGQSNYKNKQKSGG